MKFRVKSLLNISMAEPKRRYLVPGYQVTLLRLNLLWLVNVDWNGGYFVLRIKRIKKWLWIHWMIFGDLQFVLISSSTFGGARSLFLLWRFTIILYRELQKFEMSLLEIVKNTAERILYRLKAVQWTRGSPVSKYINQILPGYADVLSLDPSISRMPTLSTEVFLTKIIKCVEVY